MRAAVALALTASAAAQVGGPWTRVCNLTTSGQWNVLAYTGTWSDVSHDGRFAIFATGWYLDPADTASTDVYVRDLVNDTTFAASRGQGGVWGDGAASDGAISATGRYVAFQSTSTNLVPGNDPGFDPDIFLRDTVAGTTTRCSIGAGGVEPNDASYDPDVSGDGRYVSFVSPATNLLPNPGGFRQVFVFDRVSGSLRMASTTAAGAPGVGHCYQYRSKLSGDGRYCVFDTFASFSASDTNNTIDVYRKDLVSGAIELVSAHPTSGVASPGSYSANPSVSSDGRYVAFATGCDFAPADTNGIGTFDVYVRDMTSSAMVLISVGMSGAAGTGGSPEISADGKHVAFTSTANVFVPNDTNSVGDVFVRDWVLGQTTRESVSLAGGDPNNGSVEPSISSNGRRLSFVSYASNLVPNPFGGGTPYCYARDRGPSASLQVYCVAQVNSQGCTPAIGFNGVPSASNANPFHITATNVVNQNYGTLFYSVTGATQLPFFGGWMCVQQPLRVPGLVFSGGSLTGSDCTGTFDRDFNAHIVSGVDPALVVGQEFWAQYWSRDPAAPTTTNLTDALDAVIGP